MPFIILQRSVRMPNRFWGRQVMSDGLHSLGRVLVSVVFIVFGFLQFTHIGGYTANPAIVKFSSLTGGILSPTIVAYLVAAVDLFGGICILLGYQTRWAAIVLIIFVGLTMLLAHHFWDMQGSARASNQAHFYKNLALIGALLMLIGNPGSLSLD